MGSPKSKMLGSAQRVGKQLLLLRKTYHSDEHRVERRDQKRNVSNAAGGMHCELRSLARLQAALASCLYAQTVSCPICRSGWFEVAERQLTQMCRQDAVPVPEAAADYDTNSVQIPAEPPAPAGVVALCCHHLALIDGSRAQSEDAWVVLPTRLMTWPPDLMRCTPIFQRSQVQEPTRKGCPVAKPMSAIALLDRAGSNMLFLDLLASHGRSKSRLPACAHEACRAAKLRAKPAATAQLAWKMDGKIVGKQANQRLLLNNIKAGTTARNKLACLFI